MGSCFLVTALFERAACGCLTAAPPKNTLVAMNPQLALGLACLSTQTMSGLHVKILAKEKGRTSVSRILGHVSSCFLSVLPFAQFGILSAFQDNSVPFSGPSYITDPFTLLILP